MSEDFGSGPPNGLDPVIVGRDAIDEIERVRAPLAVNHLDAAGLLEFLRLGPVGPFLLHLAVRVSTALESFERLLKGLRDIAIVDQAATEVDDFVDVFDEQRTFGLARAASCTGPDFIVRVDTPDQ